MATRTTEIKEPPSKPIWHGTVRDRIQEVMQPTTEQWNDWKWHFRNRFNTVDKLAKVLPLTDVRKRQLQLVSVKYPFSITPYYLSLANADDPNDPIMIQSLPSFEELLHSDVGDDDPLHEEESSPVPGLVHRYPDRALFVITDICPLLCRHCTRKREWDGENWWFRRTPQLQTAIDYIAKTPAIRDVIISGGDPLTMDNDGLEWILSRLRAIPHLEMIRFGTRFPVVLPQRIDEGFCRIADKYGPIWLNTHFNHPNEVTPEAGRAVRELLRAGVPVNNQSVLLRGINDSVEVHTKLVHELLKIRVRPYYLFHADQVRGTEHLRTPVETGIKIIESLRGHTSGLGVPTYVVDVPGGGGKIPIQPNYVLSWSEDELVLRNYEWKVFHYRNPHPTDQKPGAKMAHKATSKANGKTSTGSKQVPLQVEARQLF
ncbi:MAG: KamA family radical SAM protein [Dehalococcoidia bacterium]|nr:KamA family radical SAM protein [Dehalococcoidia bacterium]MSQ17442.1 KamA family radical SAM protein [Dehalococcoidia bacterium]